MNFEIFFRVVVCGGFGLFLGPFNSAQAAPSFTITDLGVGSTAYAINELGQVVGSNGSSKAFLYSGGVISVLSDRDGRALGINNQGHIVGQLATGDFFLHAFFYDGTTFTDLHPLFPSVGAAIGINEQGQIVGQVDFDLSIGNSPFLYDVAAGTMTVFPSQPSGDTGAFAINNHGQIAVHEDNLAQLYRDSTFVTNLGTVSGGSGSTRGYAINEAGHIAGFAELEGGGSNAFLYDGSEMRDLGGETAWGNGINDLDQVVGILDGDHAFLHDGTTLFDLNTLQISGVGWVLQEAFDINNRGQIVGYGTLDGVNHGFLLTPVPIPPAGWLFASALAGLVGWRRKG